MDEERKSIGKFLGLLGLVVILLALISGSGFLFIVAIFLAIVGLYIARETDSEKKMKIEQAKAMREANARAAIKDIFIQAGNSPAEAEKKTKLAETLLRQGSDEWTIFGPTKISEIIQGVEALTGKK